ncbi:MAG: hypothetical protein ACLFVE_05100 [Chitinispirillaceae bacterium]
MIRRRVLDTAEREILGISRPFRRPAIKGVMLGVLVFSIFEYVPFIRPTCGIPPIPTTWLIGIGALAGWTVLNLRFLGVLRNVRREDLFFVYGFGISQRREVLFGMLHKFRRIWLCFVSGALGAALVLEIFILGERSFMNLALVPVGVVFGLVGSGTLFKKIIAITGPSPKDSRPLLSLPGKESFYSRFKASYVLILSKSISRCAPRRMYPLVFRNFLYLLRSEPFQPLLFVAVPLFLFVLLRYVGNTAYGMNECILMVAAFFIQMNNTVSLREAAFKLSVHPCSRARGRELLLSSAFLQSVPALCAVAVFPLLIDFQASAMYAARAFQFILALMVMSLVTGRSTMLSEERRYGFECSLLGICGLGLFIPWLGSVFIFLALFMVLFAEWRYIKRNEWFSVV